MKILLSLSLIFASLISANSQETEITIPSVGGFSIPVVISSPNTCNDCPIVVIVGDETDRNATIPVEPLQYGDCFFPDRSEPILPLKQVSDYFNNRGARTVRFDSRRATLGAELDKASYDYNFVVEDLKNVLEYVEMTYPESYKGIVTHNDGFLATSAAISSTSDFSSIAAISPSITRADTTAGNLILAEFDQCQNQRQIGLIIRNFALETLDSVAKDIIVEGRLSQTEGNFLYDEYPIYWKNKMDYSTQIAQNISQWNGDLMVAYGSLDPTISDTQAERIRMGITLENDVLIRKENNLTNILTQADRTQMNSGILNAIGDFVLGPLSVEELDPTNVYQDDNHIWLADSQKATKLTVLDITGRIVASTNGSQIAKPQTAGMYILLSDNDGDLSTYKFVVR